MERIEDCISFLVSKAAQQVARRARDKLAPHGVTPVQYAVLRALWEQDGRSGAELGARLAIGSATTTGVVDRLEAAGFLSRHAATGELNAEIASEMGKDEAAATWAALRRLGQVRSWQEG